MARGGCSVRGGGRDILRGMEGGEASVTLDRGWGGWGTAVSHYRGWSRRSDRGLHGAAETGAHQRWSWRWRQDQDLPLASTGSGLTRRGCILQSVTWGAAGSQGPGFFLILL